MTQLSEAIGRYHKILESDACKDLSWAEALRDRMQEQGLFVSAKPISPFLRPHFLTNRQYANLEKAAESLFSAINRIKQLALTTPALLSRLEMLPAEKMLASVDPGYHYFSIA